MSNKYSVLNKVTYLCSLTSIFLISCGIQNKSAKNQDNTTQKEIVSENAYQWPNKKRTYWPTVEWKINNMEKHCINSKTMQLADSMARADSTFRSLLIVKDGFLVFEKYYNEGGPDKSTEVWSVTKSFTSSLIGIAINQGYIKNIDKLMIDYLPGYQNFKDISIRHVLTHTTGLNWNEGDQQSWVQSNDWIAEALNRGFSSQPGETFIYSSGNSHFLSKLIKETTGNTLGEYAKENLFNHIGIKFTPSNRKELYSNWQELHNPIPNSWRKDNNGLEIGAFGLHITAREMAKFGFLYLNKGKWDNKILISEEWIEESTKKHIIRSENKGFGFHWVVSKRYGQFCFEADGWGGQMISIIPSLDMIVIIKCDEVNPRENNSYGVLELSIESVL